MPFRLACDFNGVIEDPQNKLPGYKMGQPIKGAVDALQTLHREGAIIVIHTVWADTEQRVTAIAEWCRYFDVPFDFITNKKPDVDLYLDDKGYKFTDWTDALEYAHGIAKATG